MGLKRTKITVTYSTDGAYLVLRTPAAITGANLAFDRDAARALIADQLAVFKFLWPDAPAPFANQAPIAVHLR